MAQALNLSGSNFRRPHSKSLWWMLTTSVLIVCFGDNLARWLGLYGGVVLVCIVCAATWWPTRAFGSRLDVANVLVMFVAYYFLMFGLYGFMNAFGMSHYLGVTYNPTGDSSVNLSALASVYAASVLLAVYAGYIWNAKGQNYSESNVQGRRKVHPRLNLRNLPRLQLSAIFALVASYVGCAMMIVFLGGASIIGRDPAYVSTEGTHGLYWAQALIWTNHWAIIVNIFSFLNTRKKKYLILSMLSGPLFLLEFMLSGSKSAILFPLMGFLIVRHYTSKRIRWQTMAALAATVLVVFAMGYAYRSSGSQTSEFEKGVASYYQDPAVLMQTVVGRFYGTDAFAIVLDTVQSGRPLMMGRSFSELLTWYIPRWIWPGKPLSFSLQFGEEFMGNAPGAGDVFYSPSLPGELYLNFGRIGLLLGGMVIGYLLRAIYRRMIERETRKIEEVVLYSVIGPLAASLSGGPISVIVEFILTRIILFALLFWIAGMVSERAFRRPISRQTLELFS